MANVETATYFCNRIYNMQRILLFNMQINRHDWSFCQPHRWCNGC